MNIKHRIKKEYFRLINKYGPQVQSIDYMGYKVYYPKGNSLIELIIRSGDQVYEKHEVERIIEELKKKPGFAFIDVGANIGLISLGIKRNLPSCEIFCFEPGKSQSNYLKKNIEFNKLDIKTFEVALSNENGQSRFSSHDPIHSSGDGFFDTGRAGKANSTIVETMTLDTWWEEHQRPKIGLIKIDTEGAEFLILKGARQVINACLPIILLEICHLNLNGFSHNADDVLNELEALNYSVNTIPDNILVTHTNRNELLKSHFSYLAIPNI